MSILLLVLAVGCGRESFIGRKYDNFTAYYNTFYNAREAFEKGLESVNQSVGTVDRARYISIFPDPSPSSGGSSFEKAIQKSADLLRQHPKSKWVDDALLLIGRARYYQQNYVGAAQKFREVIALGSGRVQEARFRLAQTLVAADRYTKAAEVLRAGLEGQEAKTDDPWTARLRLVRAELAVRREQWEAAETALERGLHEP
ncbi:MAG: tol-pal system YbgF family protein, partial [Salinibacter sp.]